MALLSESAAVLPIHRKILAFSFIGWIFDFYDLLLLSFVISTTTLRQDLALSQQDVGLLLGTALAFTAVGGFLGGALGDRYGRKPLLMITILIYSVGTLVSGTSIGFWTLFIARDHGHWCRRRMGGGARAGRRNGAAARARPLRLVPSERIGVRALLRVDD